MHIVILGAGAVGGTLAEHLSCENNDITLVDLDPVRLKELQRRLDIRTVQGYASWPQSLEEAGIENADMLIAVTDSDETNMVACQIASALYQTPRRIARIRTESYLSHEQLYEDEGFAVDVRISPESIVTSNIAHLIQYPGALQVLEFAEGGLQVVAIKPFYGGILAGKTVKAIHSLVNELEWQIITVLRRGRPAKLADTTIIEIGDEVYFVAKKQDVSKVLSILERMENRNQRIIIAGGGNIGYRLGRLLEKGYNAKIIEHNPKRTQFLAENLRKTIVLQGSATDKELLLNENIDATDVFCAVTNDDEANIIACLQAKRLGARQVIALINQRNYIDLVESNLIDVAVSPQQASVSSILRCIRQGDIVQVHSLRHDAAEVIEIVAHGDEKTSRVVGRTVDELVLPAGGKIIAIIREGQILIKTKGVKVASNDHVILLVTDKSNIKEIERSFQVKVTFFS